MRNLGVLPAFVLAISLAASALAQPQIGALTCSSATLNGTYSLTLTGRDLSSSTTFTNVEQGVGTATFDGLSAVTFNLTNNTNKAQGVAEKLSGTYSLQANCIGALNITGGDTATFILGAYNNGVSYFLTGQDGTYSLNGSGNTIPASCTTSTFNGVYSFNGNGFALASNAITGVNYVSGLMTFDGAGNISTTAYLSMNGTTVQESTKGTYTVSSNCSATATYTDSSGNVFSLSYTITSASGAFTAAVANPAYLFSISGRIL